VELERVKKEFENNYSVMEGKIKKLELEIVELNKKIKEKDAVIGEKEK
jgi:hypothetical protein